MIALSHQHMFYNTGHTAGSSDTSPKHVSCNMTTMTVDEGQQDPTLQPFLYKRNVGVYLMPCSACRAGQLRAPHENGARQTWEAWRCDIVYVSLALSQYSKLQPDLHAAVCHVSITQAKVYTSISSVSSNAAKVQRCMSSTSRQQAQLRRLREMLSSLPLQHDPCSPSGLQQTPALGTAGSEASSHGFLHL